MSYILDALKRAESERERGGIPGLNAQPMPLNTAPPVKRYSVNRVMLLLSGLAVVLLAAVLWTRFEFNSPREALSARSSAAPARSAGPELAPVDASRQAASAIASNAAPASAASAPALAAPRATASLVAPALPISPPVSNPSNSSETAPSAAKRSVKGGGADASVPALAGPVSAPAPRSMAASATNSGSRVASLNELPASIRQTLPKLVISGATYSSNPDYRMLIINGQVFHEGDSPALDLSLEEIRPRAAIFNFRGQRYSMGY